ncbi:MAG: hypothetical protein CMN55_12410 [Sneathiella sp.]|jgi:hypothetical protein|uniref:terminase small subunit-like protein n=1 Tax=Sneathiella sp. TaxID=1964365 RepID=UPI000C4608B6|nr:hypothetical protein [Sneathiella sp.]MAL79893.1 hypothetical protein [Sneathiella sp.]|tara:strand:- start:65 stop:478 length:414 start_codon:yes stop_codon:yes gene_type:complete
MTPVELIKSALYNKIWRRSAALPLLEEIKRAGRIKDIVTLLGSVFLKKEEETVRRFIADVFAGEILEIADNKITDEDAEGEAAREDVARSKLRIDTRKWLMAHFAPAQYGDGAGSDKAARRGLLTPPQLYIPENGRD